VSATDPSIAAMRQVLVALDALDGRHHERMRILQSVCDAEERLRAELHRGQAAAPVGFWARLRARWSAPPTPMAGELGERHEAMVRAVRGLGFHLLALEGAVAAVIRDQHALADLHLPTAPAHAATRLVLAERMQARITLLAAEHEVLSTRHAGLVELHAAAHHVVHALSRQALQQHMAGPRAGGRQLLQGVVLKAIEQAAELHHRVDTLEARMRQLDEEARQRRQAEAEVEGWLRPGDRDD